ncbi:MAG: alanine--tRNA ligase [Desulfurococcaceae archaeon]|nr:alanine--tRNA ligase [Desulfurococcaceae archaeon]
MGVGGSSIYRVRSFEKEGYLRLRCGVCGAYFWSRVPRDNCNDAPCADYTFFNLRIGSGPLSVREVRDRFLRFFEERGHKVVKPYPVVARWRDDLYLTIASIVVFQPHVTSGLVPPPANPLVIAQPSIRLEDIDSVGYTFGRHLTNFIMGGHHAFNYPDKYVYFTHETVEYAREFFTRVIGVPEDELVFKESWWEGGGNAGPCFEVAVGGLEVATLVFMMYESMPDGTYREIPLKIVDTGYGIERIAWLTQKTPTAFHAIYGGLLSDYHRLLGVEEPPEDVLRVSVKYVGRLNPKDEALYARLKREVSAELGLGVEELGSILDRVIKVYALLDHVKTASLMLSDGVVPSNSGEGYLARLVLRRIFRLLTQLGFDLGEAYVLFDKQIRFWGDMYEQLRGREGYVEDVLRHEVGKYLEVLGRAPSLVRKYLRRGASGLSLDELIELYDSHGVPPEVVAEVGRREGVEVVVPGDFYNRLAAKHSRAPARKVEERVKVPAEVVEAVRGLSPTRQLFHEDPYLREFTSRVVKVVGEYVVLEETAFYPEGGGQEADTGYLFFGGSAYRVVDTQKVGGVILHRVEGPLPAEAAGSVVRGVIDWERRYKLMRHHTATHVILGVARKVLGPHVWQAGAEKSESGARLDITHYKPLSDEEVRAIEDLANKVVLEGREVRTYFMPKYEAEERYGFVLYEGGVVLEPVIRVVEIEGLDAEACFGTHLRNTREVGALKIVRTEKIADGVVRLEYVAGTQVSEYARLLEGKIRVAEGLLGGDLTLRLQSLIKEVQDLRSRVSALRKYYVKELVKLIESSVERVGGLRVSVIYLDVVDSDALRDVLKEMSERYEDLVLVVLTPRGGGGLDVEVSEGSRASEAVPASRLLSGLASLVGGRGGGGARHATGYLAVGDVGRVRELVLKLVGGS